MSPRGPRPRRGWDRGWGVTDKKTLAEQFMLRANSPESWRGSARALKVCADLVFVSHRRAVDAVIGGNVSEAMRGGIAIGPVFFFLAGLAIENLVKGLLVLHGGVEAHRASLPGELKGHGIWARVARLKISLSPEEAQLVRRLETAVEWAGRYPVPREATEPLGSDTSRTGVMARSSRRSTSASTHCSRRQERSPARDC